MHLTRPLYGLPLVALHTEGVDRNLPWCKKLVMDYYVALHTEGVDRNLCIPLERFGAECRPPHGGRG